MRISRKSPKRSDAFQSRFLEAGKDAAPIRKARRLREHLAGQIIQAVLQSGFAVALLLFGRAVFNLFERHGADLNPWYLRLSLAAVLVCFVLVVRRLWARIVEIRESREDLKAAQRQMDALRESLRQGKGPDS